jgi:hypothetical protein
LNEFSPKKKKEMDEEDESVDSEAELLMYMNGATGNTELSDDESTDDGDSQDDEEEGGNLTTKPKRIQPTVAAIPAWEAEIESDLKVSPFCCVSCVCSNVCFVRRCLAVDTLKRKKNAPSAEKLGICQRTAKVCVLAIRFVFWFDVLSCFRKPSAILSKGP